MLVGEGGQGDYLFLDCGEYPDVWLQVFDRDGDGLISEEELRLTMANLGETLSQEEVSLVKIEFEIFACYPKMARALWPY